MEEEPRPGLMMPSPLSMRSRFLYSCAGIVGGLVFVSSVLFVANVDIIIYNHAGRSLKENSSNVPIKENQQDLNEPAHPLKLQNSPQDADSQIALELHESVIDLTSDSNNRTTHAKQKT